MTDGNVLKSTLSLRPISFRYWKLFHVYLVIILCTFLLRKKSILDHPLLFPTYPRPFPIFLLILCLDCHIWLLKMVGRLCVSYGGAIVIGAADFPVILDGICLWNHPQSPPLFSGICRLLSSSILLCLAYGLLRFLSWPPPPPPAVGVAELLPGHWCSVITSILVFLQLYINRLDIFSTPSAVNLKSPVFFALPSPCITYTKFHSDPALHRIIQIPYYKYIYSEESYPIVLWCLCYGCNGSWK